MRPAEVLCKPLTGSSRVTECGICSGLSDIEHAEQKFGGEHNTHLPTEASMLLDVFDFAPFSSRKRILRRCPSCGTYFLYQSDYVYLVNGSEDDEYLRRLSRQESDELLREAGREPVNDADPTGDG